MWNATANLENCLVVSITVKCILLCDLTIAFVSIYPREMKTYECRRICSWNFIAVLVIIAKNWQQIKYTSTGELVTKCGI